MIFCSVMGAISYFSLIGLLFIGSFAIEFVAVFCCGFFTIPLVPLSYDLGCEITFPVGEALSTGILITTGQLVGLSYVIKIYNIY